MKTCIPNEIHKKRAKFISEILNGQIKSGQLHWKGDRLIAWE